ncbi:hypothetical protein [Serratia proteamaculans]|uniref:hypothetical protein n=1 Tax=Serratia proteamaculans TaxID=28151 RepID=UPI0039BE36FD
MTNITESPQWVDAIYQIARADEVKGGRGGIANMQAQQLAARTLYLKTLVEGGVDFNELTFYKTAEDPDGTIAGLAKTEVGKIFRVVQGPGQGVIYYLNESGSATAVSTLLGKDDIEALITTLKSWLDNCLNDAQYSQDNFESATKDGDSINSPGACLLTLSSLALNDISRFTAWYLSVSLAGHVVRRWFLPPGCMFRDGVLKTNFNKLNFSDLTNPVVAEVSDSIVRVRYALPVGYEFTPSADMKQIHDISGVFLSTNYSSVATATERGVSNHQTPGVIQFVLTTKEVTEAGYSTSDSYGLLAYLSQIAKNSVFLVYPADSNINNTQSYHDVSSLFRYRISRGNYVFNTNAGADIYFNAAITEAPKNKKIIGGASARRVADTKNECSQDFLNYPVELRVKFKPGEVTMSEALYLTDKDGNEYPCQFAGEDHINLRKQLDVSYHADGSLACGSILFEDSLPSGQQKFYDLQSSSFPRQRVTDDYPHLKWHDSTSLSLDVGDVKYIFSSETGYTLNKVYKNGINKFIRHSTHFVTLINDTPSSSQHRLGVSIRVINSGPVFTEVEVSGYNPALGQLEESSLKMITVYRIFRSGRVRVYSKFLALKAIPEGVLYGIQTTYLTRDPSGYNLDYKRRAAVSWDAVNPYSVSLIHCVHDQHRDGTKWGPTRPYYDNIALDNLAAAEFAFGWRYKVKNDYSFLNWPIERGWAWSSESWLDFNETLADPTAIATRNNNRPVGYLGEGMWPSQVRKSITTQAGELSEAILEFLDTPAATGVGGSWGVPDNRRAWTPYATHIYNYIRYGMRTLNDIFEDFKYRQWKSYGILWNAPNMGERYLSGNLLLQWAASDTIIAMEWIYRQAELEGNTDITSALKSQLISMGDALITAADAQTVKLTPLDGSFKNYTPPSNAGAIGMRFLALAIYAGVDTDGRYLALFESMESILSTNYVFIENLLGDGYDNRPTHDLWMSYTLWASYFYLSSCSLIGRTPLTSLSSFTFSLIATAGQGALRDIDMNASESRRGKQRIGSMLFIFCCARIEFQRQTQQRPFGRMYFKPNGGHSPATRGDSVVSWKTPRGGPIPGSDIPFLAGYLADMWLFWYSRRGGFNA